MIDPKKIIELRERWLNYALSLYRGDEHKAEDLTQETLFRVVKAVKGGKYVEDKTLDRFGVVVMRNQFINEYRKNAKNPQRDFTYLSEVTASYDESYILEAFALEDIAAMVRRLPEEQRQVFILVTQGYLYKEIADMQAVPLGTIKTRISLARKKLKVNLKKLNAITYESEHY